MAPDTAVDVLARLEELEKRAAGADRLHAEVSRLRAENAELDARLLAVRFEVDAQRRAHERPQADTGGPPVPARGLSRGQFLRLGGAAAAGAAAAGAAGLLHAGPAAALTGNPLLVGVSSTPTSPADATTLYNPSVTTLAPVLLRVNNKSDATIPTPVARIAVVGLVSGEDNTSQERVGVYGLTDDAGSGFGVVGRYGADSPDIGGLNPAGVIGSARDGEIGIRGVANGSGGRGVYGLSNQGYGVVATSSTGISLWVAGGGRFHQQPRATAGAPTSGSFMKGEQIRDALANLYLCVAGGSPGTWRRLAAVKEGYAGGSINLLDRPIRLYDSRQGPNVKLAEGETRNLSVTGVDVGGVSVPSGAVAVLGNVTVVATGASGYLTLFAQGSPPSPLTASINWFATNQVLNTAALVRLNPTNGQIGIGNGLGGTSTPTHVVFDASGFVY